MDYNAAGYENEDQKLAMLTRILPFVEKRLNLIELAPKGTGKSYVFGHVSKYGLLTDGGKVTRAYNICEQNQRYFSKYREEDGKETAVPSTLTNSLKLAKEEFERNKEVISNLKSQRDTLWAHHDKRWFLDPNKIENNHPIMWQDIEALLHFASDFTNCVILNFSSGIEFPFFNSKTACFDDVQKMLSLMERGINETK